MKAPNVDNNHQIIETLFDEPTNIVRTLDVSSNSTSCISKGINSYFELDVKPLKGLIASLENQLRENNTLQRNYCEKMIKALVAASLKPSYIYKSQSMQCNINKDIDTDHQSGIISNSSANRSMNLTKTMVMAL